jgi:hypothetical protein
MSYQTQRQVCDQYGASFNLPHASARVGIALQSLHLQPLNGMRIAQLGDISGWYLWGGEYSDDADFFQPLCVEHLHARCPLAWRFLALPSGWRFLTDGEHTEVWFDEALTHNK